MTITTEVHKSHWTGERIARLSFLLGQGWDAKRQVHNGTGVGVGAPQFGIRRAILAGLTQRF